MAVSLGSIPPLPPLKRGDLGELASNLERWGKTDLQGYVVLGSIGVPYLEEEEKATLIGLVRSTWPE